MILSSYNDQVNLLLTLHLPSRSVHIESYLLYNALLFLVAWLLPSRSVHIQSYLLYNALIFLAAWLFSVLAGVLTLNLDDDDGPGSEVNEAHNEYN